MRKHDLLGWLLAGALAATLAVLVVTGVVTDDSTDRTPTPAPPESTVTVVPNLPEPAPPQEPPPPPPAPPAPPDDQAAPATVTVQPGDTLSELAAELGLSGWQELYQANTDTIACPDLIEPGEVLVVPSC